MSYVLTVVLKHFDDFETCNNAENITELLRAYIEHNRHNTNTVKCVSMHTISAFLGLYQQHVPNSSVDVMKFIQKNMKHTSAAITGEKCLLSNPDTATKS